MAETIDGRSFDALPGSGIGPDGTFETAGLPPGEYRIDLWRWLRQDELSGWSLTSMDIEGRPSLGRPIVIGASDVRVVLRFTDGTTRLAGTVRDQTGRPVPTSTSTCSHRPRDVDEHDMRRRGVRTRLREPAPIRRPCRPVMLRGGGGDDRRRLTASRRANALSKTAKTVTIDLNQSATLDLVLQQGR
jgi:hypothetical protein